MSSTTVSTRSGFDLVTKANQCLQSDPRAAQGHLAVIKKSVPTLLQELKKREVERENKQADLKREEASLERQINSKEDEKKNLKKQIDTIEEKKARNEALLNDARRELSAAESKKREAERDKDAAVAGTVGGSVGAVVLGILFPPTLIATVPAVVTAGTVTITNADKDIDRSKGKISEAEYDIGQQKRQIQAANDSILDIERDISDLSSRQQCLYAERGQLRNTIVFLQQAITYFGQLQVAVEGGQQRTDLLHSMVDLANKKQQYKILDSRGGTKVANSFAEAWESVEKKFMDGDEAGYLRVDFEDLPQLEYTS